MLSKKREVGEESYAIDGVFIVVDERRTSLCDPKGYNIVLSTADPIH